MYNPHVRVKGEVEELVRNVARKLRYSAFTVRNTALLLGLAHILALGRLPESDAEFLGLLEKVSTLAGRPIQVKRKSVGRYVRKSRKL